MLFLCFFRPLALRLPRFGKRALVLVLFVRLFNLRLLGYVCFLFFLVSWKGYGLLILDFSLPLFFNSTSRYLDNLLNIDNIYFDQIVDRIHPTKLQLNKANSLDTEAPF